MRVTKPPARHRPPARPTGKMPVPGPHGPLPPGVEPSPSTSAAREETLSQLPGLGSGPAAAEATAQSAGITTPHRGHPGHCRARGAGAGKAGSLPPGQGLGGALASSPQQDHGREGAGAGARGGATLARGALFHAACSVLRRGLLPPAAGRRLRPWGPGLLARSHTCGLLERPHLLTGHRRRRGRVLGQRGPVPRHLLAPAAFCPGGARCPPLNRDQPNPPLL